MLTRRQLLKGILAGGVVVAGELWFPGRKTIFLPPQKPVIAGNAVWGMQVENGLSGRVYTVSYFRKRLTDSALRELTSSPVHTPATNVVLTGEAVEAGGTRECIPVKIRPEQPIGITSEGHAIVGGGVEPHRDGWERVWTTVQGPGQSESDVFAERGLRTNYIPFSERLTS